MSPQKKSLEELAKEWKISVDDLKTKLNASGIYDKRITKATALDESQQTKFKEYCYPKEKKIVEKPATQARVAPLEKPAVNKTPTPSSPPSPLKPNKPKPSQKQLAVRHIQGTQIVERQRRRGGMSPRDLIYQALEKREQAKKEAAPVPPLASGAPSSTDVISAAENLLKKQEEHERKKREETEKKIAKPLPAEAPKPAQAPKSRQSAPKMPAAATITIGEDIIKKRERARNRRQLTRSEAAQSAQQHVFQKPTEPIVREVRIPDVVSVSRLASDMSLKSGTVIRKLMEHGMTFTANEFLDKETAWIIVEELGHKPVDAPVDDAESELLGHNWDEEVERQSRAPVITVMGHVDHGKTSLLDYIRKTRVAAGEAGGITQHIRAYRVSSAIGTVTFLDTPGHELFTQMRARGAKVTDIVVLVVAADDGVKPQTVEAINHARAANVPIVVAANKMDRPDADLERIKSELSSNEVLAEDWGGDSPVIPVSATTGEGVDKLLDAISLQADLLELSAPIEVPATAVVVETRVDRGRGIVATLVVTAGVLKRGAAFLCGAESGRIRAMWNAELPSVEEAYPSVPVEIQGLTGVPEAGAQLFVLDDERKARDLATQRQRQNRDKQLSRGFSDSPATRELLDAVEATENWRELKVVVKADVEGSREALAATLSTVSGKNAGIKVVHSAVGGVTESDIYLAQASNGIIVAFNVRPSAKSRKLAESRNVPIIVSDVVYELVEKSRQSVLNLLSPTVEEKVVGSAEVLQVFNISKVGNIAGCRVIEGIVQSGVFVRLVRDSVKVYEGNLSSLRHFKDEVAEVRNGQECGIGIAKFNDIKVGDIIEAVQRIETPSEL